jgi:hypothetical protein
VPDLQIGPALHELKGIRSDRSHPGHSSHYNGAQVTGVEKREVKIPMEIQQKQAVDLDEKMSGVAAPAPVGPRGSGSSTSWAG